MNASAPFTYGFGSAPAAHFEPAHPLVADALCATGRLVADVAEPLIDELTDWRQDAFWVAVIAFVLWVVVPNLPAIAAVLP